ncbi:T9SS type A sorting domain-containing protein [bacterium]|nr:T9SS type A sorting domain-containing protein [bacterium]
MDDNTNLVAYPNPTNNTITVEWKSVNSNINTIITLVDQNGRAVQKVNAENGSSKVVIDVTELEQGVYYIELSGPFESKIRFVKL